MNYLKELLESYSRLKQRKLKLLEQGFGGGGTQVQGNTPQERIAFMANGVGTATSDSPAKFIHNNQQFSVFRTKPRREDPNGHVTIKVELGSRSKNFKPPYQGLEKYLGDSSEGEPETPKMDEPQQASQPEAVDQDQFNTQAVTDAIMQAQPGAGVAQSELSLTSPEVAQKMVEIYTEISGKVDKIWESLSKDFKRHYKTKENLALRLYGGRGSLESQVSKAFVIVKDANGNLVTIRASGDEYMSLEVTKAIRDILEITSKTTLTDSDKTKLDSLVSYTKDGEIIIFDSGGAEGMLFRPGKSNVQGGVLGAILKSFEEKFNHKIQVKDPTDLTLSKQDNALQSTFFEDINSVLALGSTCKQGMDVGGPNKKKIKQVAGKRKFMSRTPADYCSQMIKHLMWRYASKTENLLKILTPISLLERSNQDYAMVLEKGDTTIAFLREVIKNGTDKMYQSIIRIAKNSMVARKPERSIPKGQETRHGRRADATEVWSSKEKLIQALRNSGVTDEDIQKYGFIKEITIEEAYGDLNKKLRSLDKGYKKNQKVFVLDISYKNYLSLKERAKAGTGYATTRNYFLDGRLATDPTAKPDELAADQKFRKAMSQNLFGDSGPSLDIGSTFLKEMSEYNNNQIEPVFNLIKDLPINAQTLTPDGKKLKKSQVFKTLAKSVIDTLNKDSSYSELFGREYGEESIYMDPDSPFADERESKYQKQLKKDSSKDKRELVNYLDKFVKAKKGESQEDLIIRAKGALATYLKNKKLQSHLASDDPVTREKAKRYLGIKYFLAGGANSDSLLCDYRELYGKDNYMFRQNESFSLVREWLSGNKDYDIKWDGNSYTIFNKTEDDVAITCQDSRIESDKDKLNGIQSSITSVFFSRGLLKKMDKRGRRQDSNTSNENSGELILEFLNSQKDILTKIFNIISKDV